MIFPFTHAGASDDSKHQEGRYNSLALVSFEYKYAQELQNNLSKLLVKSGIESEFKWNKLNSARERFVAHKMINFTLQNLDKLRIDVLIWDMEDKRHKGVKGRDDKENLVRMYYHLVSTTLSRRWPVKDSIWKWRPDEQSNVDWNTLFDCIRNKRHNCVQDLFSENSGFESVDLKEIIPSKSQEWSLIQLADLFAGMSTYSWGHHFKFLNWKVQKSNQQSIFETKKIDFSPGEEEKFTVISHFIEEQKKVRLPISCENALGFETHNSNCRINFWPYTPQHQLDKAPVKK